MIDFCPDGYVPLHEAMFTAAKVWYPEQISALETAAAPVPELQTKPNNSLDAAVRAFSQPIPAAWQDDAWRHAFANIWSETAHRLRNLLHQDTIKAYYFDNNGRHAVPCDFWPTPGADGVLETGIYWSFGRYPLFFGQSELDGLLSEQPAKKRPFPIAKMPELVAALHKLDDLPNRAAQHQAVSNMPEFREFRITNARFREAARQAPRGPGRKSRR